MYSVAAMTKKKKMSWAFSTCFILCTHFFNQGEQRKKSHNLIFVEVTGLNVFVLQARSYITVRKVIQISVIQHEM